MSGLHHVSGLAAEVIHWLFEAHEIAARWQQTQAPGYVPAFARALHEIDDATAVLQVAMTARPTEGGRNAEELFAGINQTAVNVPGGGWSASVHEGISCLGLSAGMVMEEVRRASGNSDCETVPVDLLADYMDVAIKAFYEMTCSEDEVNQVSAMREQELARALATETDSIPCGPAERKGSGTDVSLIVDLTQSKLTLDGTEHEVTSKQALRWIKVLAAHPGEWISSSDLKRYDTDLDGTRPDILKNHLPQKLLDLIDSATGKGSRLRLRK